MTFTLDVTLKRYGDIIEIVGTGYSVNFNPKDFERTLDSIIKGIIETTPGIESDTEEFKRQKESARQELTLIYRDYHEEQQQKSSEKNKQKKEPQQQQEDSKNKKKIYVQKYAASDFIAERVLIGGNNTAFAVYTKDTNEITIKPTIALDEDTELVPLALAPEMPYSFDCKDELKAYQLKAQMETLDTLYHKLRTIVSKYLDANAAHIDLVCVSIFATLFQDKMPTVHYIFFVGDNDSGKSTSLKIISVLGYRGYIDTASTAPNTYRAYGCVQIGQCTLLYDEISRLDQNPELMEILKNGNDQSIGLVRRSDASTESGKIEGNYYYAFGPKFFAAERLPDIIKAQGLHHRIITVKCFNGDPQFSINEVLNPQGDPELESLNKELMDARKLLLCYRIIHYFDQLPNIHLNIRGREADLFKPYLRIFQGTNTFDRLASLFSAEINYKRGQKQDARLAVVFRSVRELIGEKRTNKIAISEIWGKVIGKLSGSFLPGGITFLSEEFGKITTRKVANICREVLGAENVPGHASGKKLFFDREMLIRVRNNIEKNKVSIKLLEKRVEDRRTEQDPILDREDYFSPLLDKHITENQDEKQDNYNEDSNNYKKVGTE